MGFGTLLGMYYLGSIGFFFYIAHREEIDLKDLFSEAKKIKDELSFRDFIFEIQPFECASIIYLSDLENITEDETEEDFIMISKNN